MLFFSQLAERLIVLVCIGTPTRTSRTRRHSWPTRLVWIRPHRHPLEVYRLAHDQRRGALPGWETVQKIEPAARITVTIGGTSEPCLFEVDIERHRLSTERGTKRRDEQRHPRVVVGARAKRGGG